MRYNTGQFGSFDGLDNRKAVLDLFRRLGWKLPELLAARQRAHLLSGLMGSSETFHDRPAVVAPCSAAEAYLLWVGLTGAFGVPAEESARALEQVVRAQ